MLCHPYILGDPQLKGGKISGRLTPAFWGAQQRAQMLRHPYILGGAQTKGGQNQWPPHPCLLGGPKEGGNATSPLHSRGSPNKGGQNQNWLPHPCFLGGPNEGGSAMSPLHSRGSPNKGGASVAASLLPSRGAKRGRKCYVNPAFSGIPKQRGTKSEGAAARLPSRRPRRG